ncbi:MAG: DUF1592 domain-containing protein [Bradymonadia bacterium]
MKPHRKMRGMSAVAMCLWIMAVVWFSGCSLLLDPNTCSTQADCEQGQICLNEVCLDRTSGGESGDGPDADALILEPDASMVGPLPDARVDDVVGGPVTLRRLTRQEYNNSMKDLIAFLGEDLLLQESPFIDEVTAALPPDAVFKGFENLASRQSSSDIMVEAHWTAAQVIANRLAEKLPPIESFVDCGEPAPRVRIQSVQMTRADGQDIGDEFATYLINGFVLFDYNITEPGAYRFHMRAWGEQLALEGPDVVIEVNGEPVHEFDVNSLEPFTYESDAVVLDEGVTRFHVRFINDDSVEGVGDINFYLQWLEFEGPIDQTVEDADARRRACLDQFIEWVGLRAWRRPLDEEELVQLRRIYQAGAADGGFHTGIEAMLAGVFFSPRFLYVLERGDVARLENGRVPLDGWSLAGRLAQALWGSLPDDALLQAAAAGELDTREGVMSQARRMLGDPRARTRILDFFSRWLMLYEVPTISRSEEIYDGNLDLFKGDILKETLSFIEYIVFDKGGDYADLMVSTSSFMNTRLGRFYGVDVQGSLGPNDFVDTPLPTEQRLGLLTHASLLSVTSKHIQTSPVARGMFIQEQILCREMPPPPDFNTQPPQLNDAMTTRQRWDAMTTQRGDSCANCHALINPVGFLFEKYDAVGRFRLTEAGLPIDDSGHVAGTIGLEDNFNGPLALADALSQHPDALNCMARQWFRYGMGRWEGLGDEIDDASIAFMAERLDAEDGGLAEMIVALTGSEAFLTTLAPEGLGEGEDEGAPEE